MRDFEFFKAVDLAGGCEQTGDFRRILQALEKRHQGDPGLGLDHWPQIPQPFTPFGVKRGEIKTRMQAVSRCRILYPCLNMPHAITPLAAIDRL